MSLEQFCCGDENGNSTPVPSLLNSDVLIASKPETIQEIFQQLLNQQDLAPMFQSALNQAKEEFKATLNEYLANLENRVNELISAKLNSIPSSDTLVKYLILEKLYMEDVL